MSTFALLKKIAEYTDGQYEAVKLDFKKLIEGFEKMSRTITMFRVNNALAKVYDDALKNDGNSKSSNIEDLYKMKTMELEEAFLPDAKMDGWETCNATRYVFQSDEFDTKPIVCVLILDSKFSLLKFAVFL